MAPPDVDLLRRRVINVVGHELRTPVTTLRGLAELLAAAPDADNAAEVRESLVRTARRTEALLDDLLVASGVTTALPVGEPEPAPMAGVVVLARRGTPERILAAVVDNAERYAGGAEVQGRVEGDRAVVVVADRGPGMPEADLAFATEAFFRGEQAVLGHHSLGLGLAVVRALVEQEGGTIDIRNRDGGGLEVELRLPAAP